jgi:hypothetical protein
MPIGEHGFIAIVKDTDGNMTGLHSRNKGSSMRRTDRLLQLVQILRNKRFVAAYDLAKPLKGSDMAAIRCVTLQVATRAARSCVPDATSALER